MNAGSYGKEELGGGAEDGVAAIAHGGFVLKFVHQVKALQGADNAHEVGQAGHLDGAVNLPSSVAHADGHDIAAKIRVGVFFDGDQYLVVHGQRLYALDELGGQDGFLSDADLAGLRAALRYLRKVCESFGLHGVADTSKQGASA